MPRSSSIPLHRRSRRARRSPKMRRLAWVAVALLITLWAFGGGYLWRQLRTKSAAAGKTTEQAVPEQRAQALELLDRAVTARHGELTNEAVRLALDAQRLDADVPGAALFLAEMSLRAGDAEGLNAAANEALTQENSSADAQLLLALSAWMLRGQRGSEDAGRASTQLLAEAAEAELANNQVRFFAGDLLRAIGQPAEAHANLLGSLFRQAPWDSTALLVAKLWLALEEAGPDVQAGAADRSGVALDTGPEGEIYGAAAVRLKELLDRGTGTAASLDELRTVLTAKQASLLLGDPAMGAAGTAANKGDRGLLPPFAKAVSAVEAEEEEMSPEAPRENPGRDRLFPLPENVPPSP